MKEGLPIERACELAELKGVLKARKIKFVDVADAASVDPALITRQFQGERSISLADTWEYAWQTCLAFHTGGQFSR